MESTQTTAAQQADKEQQMSGVGRQITFNSESLFEPEIVLREQLMSSCPPHKNTGEYRLVVAVLEDALRHLFRPLADTRWIGVEIETIEWMYSLDSEWPFSYERICEVLGIEAMWLRRITFEALIAKGFFIRQPGLHEHCATIVSSKSSTFPTHLRLRRRGMR